MASKGTGKKRGKCGTILWVIIILGMIGAVFGDKENSEKSKKSSKNISKQEEAQVSQTNNLENEYMEKTKPISVIMDDSIDLEQKENEILEDIETIVTADRIIDLYLDSRKFCKDMYDGKRIKIFGRIMDEVETYEDRLWFSIEGNSREVSAGITCYFDCYDVESMQHLEKGDYVSVIGMGMQGAFTFDMEKCCELQNISPEEYATALDREPLLIQLDFCTENDYSIIDSTRREFLSNIGGRMWDYVYKVPEGIYRIYGKCTDKDSLPTLYVEDEMIVNKDGFDMHPIKETIIVEDENNKEVMIKEGELLYVEVNCSILLEEIK